MSFLKASDSAVSEQLSRRNNRARLLTFGIDYLDDAMVGIMPNDLILIGAGSGSGKTQVCCNIAAANVANRKRVHYIALEAELFEIERRVKYNFFSKHFFADPLRPRGLNMSFQSWMMGDFFDSCEEYERKATIDMQEKFNSFFTFYKQEKFDLSDMIFTVTTCAEKTDLIIIDHVHYFDYDDEKENQAIKAIAKAARSLTLEQGKPMILVSHLRKRDKFSNEICPGLEEFHGSSDLYKISTKAITLGPGGPVDGGGFETFFRIVKNRFNGGVTRYLGKVIYREGSYEKGYEIGSANQRREDGFVATDRHLYPEWCSNSHRPSGDSSSAPETRRVLNFAPGSAGFVEISQ